MIEQISLSVQFYGRDVYEIGKNERLIIYLSVNAIRDVGSNSLITIDAVLPICGKYCSDGGLMQREVFHYIIYIIPKTVT